MENIQQIGRKIKRRLDAWSIPFVVLLLAFSMFGLGYRAGQERNSGQVTVTFQNTHSRGHPLDSGGELIGSKTGSTYFFPWCAGAQKIPQQEQVRFADEREAALNGYTPGKGCKGLGAIYYNAQL